jgi:hypothetical protein
MRPVDIIVNIFTVSRKSIISFSFYFFQNKQIGLEKLAKGEKEGKKSHTCHQLKRCYFVNSCSLFQEENFHFSDSVVMAMKIETYFFTALKFHTAMIH